MEKMLENPIKLPSLKKSSSSRIKDYLKAYSYTNILVSRPDTSHPAKTARDDIIVRPFTIRNQFSSKLDKQKQSEDSKRKAELVYEISVAKSDKLEIVRDLSTYEYELSCKINIPEKLEIMAQSLASIPSSFDNVYSFASETDKISNLIKDGLNHLHGFRKQSFSSNLSSEYYKIREHNTLRRMQLLYKSIKKVSGVRVLISIKGDVFFENFLVSLATTDNEIVVNVPIKLDILAVDTLNQSVEMTSAIEQKILPHLYLVYKNRKLQVKFDENFPNEKISVIFYMKNWGKTSALLSQIDESIMLYITDPEYEKKINRSQVLNFDQVLSTVPLKSLSDKLSRHLKYIISDDKYDIEWIESSSEVFNRKEQTSKLMNEEYIKESLGTQAFTRVWEQELRINNSMCFIQCFSYHSLRKILIGVGGKSLEIKPESQTYRFIVGLQSIDIAKNPVTLCNSLELKKLIKSYFF